MTELFRRQAVDYQRLPFHGAIVLARNPWRTATVTGFLLLVGALLAFAATQGFTRKETVTGVLLPSGGVLRLVAPQAGVVLAQGAVQGQRVAAGDAILRLSAEQSSASGPTRAAVGQSLALRQATLQGDLRTHDDQVRLQAAAFAAQAHDVEAAIARQEQALALQRQRVQLVGDVAARYPDLVRSGAVSPVEAAEKQDDFLLQQGRLADLDRDLAALRGQLAQIGADRAALPLAAQRERAQIERDIQGLAQAEAENESLRESRVLAPVAGEVGAVLAQPGQAVDAGQTLATLLPSGGALEAELYVPTRAAGVLRVGSPVWLRVDAFPYERYGQLRGEVRTASVTAVPAGALAAGIGDVLGRGADDTPDSGTAARLANPGANVYRVRVALEAGVPGAADDFRSGLKPGMRVQASLMGEHRTLLQWALEPLAAVKALAP